MPQICAGVVAEALAPLDVLVNAGLITHYLRVRALMSVTVVFQPTGVLRACFVACMLLIAGCAVKFDQLPPIDPTVRAEVRLRQQDVMSGGIVAYVVQPDSVTIYRQARSESSVQTVSVATEQVFVVAADLIQDDGESFGCEVYDGDQVDIDMVLEGRSISVQSSNPWLCQHGDAGSQRVQRLFDAIKQTVAEER